MNNKNGRNGFKMCDVHGEIKDSYCLSKSCMTDLCKMCLIFHKELHNEQGSQPFIDKIKNVLSMSSEKIQRMSWGYEREIKKLESAKVYRDQEWELAIREIRKKIQVSKKVVDDLVEAYFKETEDLLMKQYIYPARKMASDSLENAIEKLKFKLQKLGMANKSISTETYENEMIKYVLSKKDDQILINLSQSIDHLISKEGKLPDPEKVEVAFEQENLQDLYKAIQNFVNINVSLKDLLNESSFIHNSNFDEISQMDIEPAKAREIKVKEEIEHSNQFKINQQDYFSEDSPTKIIHFFEPKTKNFFYLNLADHLEKDHKLSFKTPFSFEVIPLKMNSNILRHHKSIITPEGYIILTGGLEENPKNAEEVEVKSNSFILDSEELKLVEISQMIYPRAAHSIVWTPMGIVAAGGITTGCEVTKTCELYNIEENSWSEIPSMEDPTINSLVLLFNSNYLLKIGGKVDQTNLANSIEIFSFEKNFWRVVDHEPDNVKLPSGCSGIQINSNQILIFGGSYEDNVEKTDEIKLITLSKDLKKAKIERVQFSLPNKEEFLNQQSFLLNGNILALQNVSGKKSSNSIYVGERKLLLIGEKNAIYLN